MSAWTGSCPAIAGPPADAGQSLPRYPLKIEDGLLYLEAPLERLAQSGSPSGREDAT